jgi:hypothetical protein
MPTVPLANSLLADLPRAAVDELPAGTLASIWTDIDQTAGAAAENDVGHDPTTRAVTLHIRQLRSYSTLRQGSRNELGDASPDVLRL